MIIKKTLNMAFVVFYFLPAAKEEGYDRVRSI
jgi:hypothetical protein